MRWAFVLFMLNLAGALLALLALLAEDFPSRIWLYANTVLAAVIGYVRLVAQPGVLDSQPAAPADRGAGDKPICRQPLER